MKIYAKEGYILTNGNVYGYVIDLGSKDSETNYHEITQAEYEEIMAREEINEQDELADAINALNLLGVE